MIDLILWGSAAAALLICICVDIVEDRLDYWQY